jgi:hypothetical protein
MRPNAAAQTAPGPPPPTPPPLVPAATRPSPREIAEFLRHHRPARQRARADLTRGRFDAQGRAVHRLAADPAPDYPPAPDRLA